MKLLLPFLLLAIGTSAFSQRKQAINTSNLKSTKSSNYSIYYPIDISENSISSLLNALEKKGVSDPAETKNWIFENAATFGIKMNSIRNMKIYSSRQFADCSVCKKNCKGRCVDDWRADCVCVSTSEPNLRTNESNAGMSQILFVFPTELGPNDDMNLVYEAIQKVKSSNLNLSKSN